MEAITVPIYNLEGKKAGTLKLNASVFDGNVNEGAVHQAIIGYRANNRRGLASTKTRGEVSGGGKKPWKQKGTGRARVGSIRSPLWRHGGVIFGPHPRDFSYNIPQKIKDLALKSTLNAKVKEDNFIILDNFSLNTHKTKDALKIFENLKLNPKKLTSSYSVLVLVEKTGNNEKRALRNINFVNLNKATDTNPYEVLSHHKLVITKDGLDKLTERLL
ncbi:MAG: 50S ribosomal protein L4 [Candidatus Omnitrophota bacterium]